MFIVASILYSHSKTMIGGGAMCERQNCERGGAVIAAPPRIRGAPGFRSCDAPFLPHREARMPNVAVPVYLDALGRVEVVEDG